MPVNKRSYSTYSGPVTPASSRFLILTRFGLADVWSSRITTVLCIICMMPTIVALFTLYIVNSDTARLLLSNYEPMTAMSGTPTLVVDQRLFFGIFVMQCWAALALTAWVGPRLMAADLTNNALPIILSRPITRWQYMVGKLTVLWALLSAVTWLPMLLLFAYQAHLSQKPWAGKHMFIATGTLIGGIVWVLLLSLLSLAVSSWVRWRIVATAFIFGTMFIAGGIGAVYNAVMGSRWGNVINIPYMVTETWMRLMHIPRPWGMRGELPTPAIALALAGIAVACGLALNARIRAREVVRG